MTAKAARGAVLVAVVLAASAALLPPLLAAAPAAPARPAGPALSAGPAVAPARAGHGVPDGPGGESAPTYDVLLSVRSDGVLHVRETITYDFAGPGEHGIVRRVPYRTDNRLYDIRHVRASSSTGAPARVRAVKVLHDMQIRVGEDDRRAPGRQAYVIEYDVSGAFTRRAGRAELRWEAIGGGWDVPIGEAAVRVEALVPLRRVACRAGAPKATTRCLMDRDGPYAIDFTQRGLRPHEAVTIRLALPAGAVRVPPPRYARPHLAASWPGYVVLAGALGLAVLMLRRPPAASRRAGLVLLAGGAAAVVYDVADDTIARGFWAASVGDLLLVGTALIIVGATIILTGPRGRAPERHADMAHQA